MKSIIVKFIEEKFFSLCNMNLLRIRTNTHNARDLNAYAQSKEVHWNMQERIRNYILIHTHVYTFILHWIERRMKEWKNGKIKHIHIQINSRLVKHIDWYVRVWRIPMLRITYERKTCQFCHFKDISKDWVK